MTEDKARVCLITGASAGIGAAIAREYASRGWDLALCARREAPMVELANSLKQSYGTTSHIFPIDLFEVGAVSQLVSRIEKKSLQIDGVVNNAGYGHPGLYLESAWDDHDKFLHLMLRVPCELTHALLPDMKGSKGHTLYAAVKSFLIKFSQSLNLELTGAGVHVSALCPGFTLSEFHDVNGTRDAVSRMPGFMWMDAQDCAEMGVEACERDIAVFIPGRVNKSIALLARLLPTSLAQYLVGRNSERFRKI